MRTKISIVSCVTIIAAVVLTFTAALPAQDVATIDNFQETLQQQSYLSVLTSIEERLRNLDNIYSMQLSRTLETKLDQYSRRLEALDTKIIRLEALVMLNLDKISENISTKNFKDDMTKSTMLRKMDTIYEGLSHRLGYLERKYDSNMAKIQTKVDATMTRFEKVEENMMARDSDIEAEMSDVIFAIDDLKTTCTAMEQRLVNITSATLNFTKTGHKTSQEMYVTTRKSMNVLHDNIIETLQYMNNKTSRQYKLVGDNNLMLKAMKSELKEDFNEYANKVADMSSYAWKNSDTMENDIMRLEAITNSTRTEVQNGVRSLMVQIGKITNKENVLPLGDDSLEEINKSLKTNFQKILTNQDLFLESCHRVQMDESQIESEISVTLENLINMLEKRMAVELKDIKNIERLLRMHDNRVLKNMSQLNGNLISLFQKSTISTESMKRDINKIGNDLGALFLFIQRTSTHGSQPLHPINLTVLQEKFDRLESIASRLSNDRTPADKNNISDAGTNATENLYENIRDQIQNLSINLSLIEEHLKNVLNENHFNEMLHRVLENHFSNCSVNNATKNVTQIAKNDTSQIDDETERLIKDIFGPNSKLAKSNPSLESVDGSKIDCRQNYIDIIDVRAGIPNDCETMVKSSSTKKNHTKTKKTKSFLDIVDIRGNFDDTENQEYDDSFENLETTTVNNIEDLVTEQILNTEE